MRTPARLSSAAVLKRLAPVHYQARAHRNRARIPSLPFRVRQLGVSRGEDDLRIMVIGATGLIGSAVVARLLRDGHELIGVARGTEEAARAEPAMSWRELDIARASEGDWLNALHGCNAVVNCAGVLQDGPADDVEAVHETGPRRLFAACEQAGVTRFVHLSAIGVDRETPTAFSGSKRAGEQALMDSALDWVILRPSVVVGRPAYGGSALFRGLAALPVLPVMPRTGPLQVVALDDVVETVALVVGPDFGGRVALDLAGPERLTMPGVVAEFRRWLGRRPARSVQLPSWLASALYGLGDFVGRLGWKPPLRSTARQEIVRGATTDQAEAWSRTTGIAPRSLGAMLSGEPASVQEKWFADLYVLKPLIFVIFAGFWIATGIVSIGPGYQIGVDLMLEGGAGVLAGPSVIAGGLADLAIGFAIAIRRTSRWGLYAALAISLFYAAAGSLLLPRLWIEPLGPLLKIWPIIMLNLVALALLRDR